MLSTSASPQKTLGNQPASFKVAACAGVALLVAGLTGQISAGWGYAQPWLCTDAAGYFDFVTAG